MGVYYMILEGYGYVIPKSSLTKKELEEIGELLADGEDHENLEMVEQGCYTRSGVDSDTENTQLYIGLIDESKLLNNVKLSFPENIAIGCSEFAVMKLLDDDTPDYYKKREGVLAEKKKALDRAIEIVFPKIASKLQISNRFNDWIFGYYQ